MKKWINFCIIFLAIIFEKNCNYMHFLKQGDLLKVFIIKNEEKNLISFKKKLLNLKHYIFYTNV